MLVDVHERSIYPAIISFSNSEIISIEKSSVEYDNYILPGLIDAHVHIESSMITPGAFAVAAVKQGTTGTVSDPHEIANVLGTEGIDYMIRDAEKVPVNFWFGAPSCVPATGFETNGAVIDHIGIRQLLMRREIKYLAEIMNFPGVIYNDKEVREKLRIAKKLKKPVDGHAPGLKGEMLKKYISAGISTDHECSSLEEGIEKISLGMKVLIREGSAARNLDSLKELIRTNPDMVMLCSDDIHPEMLAKRHINKLVAKLIVEGFDPFDVIRSCTVNPALHYRLEAGLLKPGQPADFIIVDDYRKMNVLETWIKGEKVYDRGNVLFTYSKGPAVNNFICSKIMTREIKVANKGNKIQIIEAFDGELITKRTIVETGHGDFIEADLNTDILKIVVKDRYHDAPPAIGFIRGFGIKKGAFASSVAHDNHNIICVGTNDEDIVTAINEIVRLKGGISVTSGGKTSSLKLNIAGIMSDSSCGEVARKYETLTKKVKDMGSNLKAPFMTLSFMALLVIPELKIGDKGLFDVEKFCPASLYAD